MSKNQTPIAAIRIHGKMKIKKDIASALHMLHLYKQNSCIILPPTPSYTGMLIKLKDYITWGELDKETCLFLLQKRGKLAGNKPLTESYLQEKIGLNFVQFTDVIFNFEKGLKDVPGLKPFFRLSPPRHGFGTKGIKKPFSLGGTLGYRKDKINDLIKSML